MAQSKKRKTTKPKAKPKAKKESKPAEAPAKRGPGRPRTKPEIPDEDVGLDEFLKQLPSLDEINASPTKYKDICDTFYRRAKALKEYLAGEQLIGNLIPRDEVEALLTTRAVEFKKALTTLEKKLPPLLNGMTDLQAIQNVLHEAFRKVMEVYSR